MLQSRCMSLLIQALFCAGTGQNGIGAAWGDGFVTDGSLISQNGLSDPRPFFDGLLSKPYVGQVCSCILPMSLILIEPAYKGSTFALLPRML